MHALPHNERYIGCLTWGASRAVAEELFIEPIRERLLSDQNFLAAVSALKDGPPENQTSAFEVRAASPNRDSGDRPMAAREYVNPGPEGAGATRDGAHPDALLAAQLAAIESAVAVGAISRRDALVRCAALRAEHERVTRPHVATDETSTLVNAERLRAALVLAASDALRPTLGTVHCQPTVEGSTRYLMAQVEGGDAALLEWLAIGDTAQKPGLTALGAGAGFPLGFTTVPLP